jgi:magnesium-transporting ATPase (P-type)
VLTLFNNIFIFYSHKHNHITDDITEDEKYDQDSRDNIIVIDISNSRNVSSTDIVKKNSDVKLFEDEDLQKVLHSLSFPFSNGLTTNEAEELLKIHGRNELPEKVIPKWYIFVSQLWQPMPMMIWLAVLIEAAILNFIDMSVLLFIQFANASIAYYEITKAGDAVAVLKSQLQAKATVMRDGT